MSSRDFFHKQDFWQKLICDSQDYTLAMRGFLQSPDDYIAQHSKQYFKNTPGDTTTVSVLDIGNKTYVVKRYNIKGWRHAVDRAIRPSRASRSWHNAFLLASLGVATPRPVAMMECRFGPLRGKAYFLCEYVAGQNAREYFCQGAQPLPQWPQVAAGMVDILKRLESALVNHSDPNNSNFLIADHTPILIDLDHMRQHNRRWTFLWGFWRDRRNFMKYWDDSPVAKQLFVDLLTCKPRN